MNKNGQKEEPGNICPADVQQWRQWLQEHHAQLTSVWLVYYRKSAASATLSYNEAVDEALCFGWIDSTRRTLDNERYMQLFSRRKPRSVWSKINKEKVRRLILEGRMTPAGLDVVKTAKKNGYWNILNDAEALKIPADLSVALSTDKAALRFFNSLSRSDRKRILQWLLMAKRAETRQNRIQAVFEALIQGQKPAQLW